MDIYLIPSEAHLILSIAGQQVVITPFIDDNPAGIVKMGIDAPADIPVNREEIYGD